MIVTSFTGNELYCLNQKGFNAGNFVLGNTVHSLGLRDSLGSNLSTLGIEIEEITQKIKEGRLRAYQQMVSHATEAKGNGIIGINSKLEFHATNIEFLSTGSIVRRESETNKFTTNANAQELFALLDAGYQPINYVFGNVAYSTKSTGGLIGKLKTGSSGEAIKFTRVFEKTHRLALIRIVEQAKTNKASAVVGIQTSFSSLKGVNEIVMEGTAVSHPDFTESNEIISSNLSHQEVWSLAKIGYVPMRLLLGTSVISLGFLKSIATVAKSFFQTEVAEYTQILNEARKNTLESIKIEADEIGADKVIGIKTYVFHLNNGLIAFLTMGTAIKKHPQIKTHSNELPWQAIENKSYFHIL